MSAAEPLIITALLEPETQKMFDQLRAKHFPKEINYLQAHVTLFHALPGDEESAIREHLTPLRINAQVPATVTAVYALGRGVAFRVKSAEMSALRTQLADEWQDWLIPQDRNKAELHVTVQNKVDPIVAKQLLAELSRDFEPFDTHFIGLSLWRYKNGPWEHASDVRFV